MAWLRRPPSVSCATRRFAPALVLSLVALSVAAPPLAAAESAPLGFFPSSAAAQARAEAVFLATPAPDQAARFLRALTEEPHVAGTPQEKVVADYVKARFEEFGLATEVATYEAFLNHPRSVSLKLVAPVEEELSLVEPAVPGDKDSGAHGMFPAFHGYGASGRAEGQVVYANYGTRADFERLKALGVDVAGRIVLARYGQVFRGLKVKEAQDRGALGVLIYSDPADDGYAQGDPYPDGPMRPHQAIQRGSVQFLSLGPGDPTTPGYASLVGARRVPRDKLATIPKIPSLPIAYAEAEKILRRLGGANAPEGWQGGLPFAYHLGPGTAAVALDVRMDEGLKPIYNVFARIPGAAEPERLVIVGNHRDAWTHGAVDPNSGTAVLLELARGLGAALKAGWRPRRTILLASWDAEEYGLVGSTEWAEQHAEALQRDALAYLNIDAAVTGADLRLGGVPSLREVVREAAAAVAEPRQGGTLLAAWERREQREWARQAPVDLSAPERPFEAQLDPLGSGSDYTAFLDHLGIPALDLSFSGRYGVYHSVYDNYRWMAEHGDPGFQYHAAAARLLGLVTLRLASADVVPLRFGAYGRALRDQLDALRRDARRRARDTGAPATRPAITPDFAPLVAALEAFSRAGEEADRALEALARGGDEAATGRANAAAAALERGFLAPQGLPGRPWFRHLLVAPGTTTGYAPWPFPGLVQALEDRDAALFASQAAQIEAALRAATERLTALGALVPGSRP
jgi:N-acetylated-alpha-linked acidic dipeptidase